MDSLINRQAAIDVVRKCRVIEVTPAYILIDKGEAVSKLAMLPSAQKKGYTKADYIMALHNEYGCSVARAEEAHQKALEYLRNTSMMKG